MPYILDPQSLKPGGNLFVSEPQTGIRFEADTFTCGHCNRVIVKVGKDGIPRRATFAEKEGWRCKQCNQYCCKLCLAVGDCNDFRRDAERAIADLDNQPWLLRHYGEPVRRIVDEQGNERLVLARDNGYTLREQRKRMRSKDAD